MLHHDIFDCIFEKIEHDYHLMSLRQVCKHWKQSCETIIRSEVEDDVRNMLTHCRYKCEKVPLKWIVRRNLITPMVEYKCAYCNATVYSIGECKNKHRKRHKIIQDICIGPFVLVCFILFVKGAVR